MSLDSKEMHPHHHHASTAKPLDEARWLGFTQQGAQTEPSKGTSKLPIAQVTPSKSQRVSSFTSPDFQFTFIEPTLELSLAAKKLMAEKREEAAKIKAQMVAEGAGFPSIQEQIQRKIATPKGKAGRFSDIHMAEFRKMDSIANHASALRADPTRFQTNSTSLKRSPSKAELDQPESLGAGQLQRSKSRPLLDGTDCGIPRPKSSHSDIADNIVPSSPAKCSKLRQQDDTSANRPVSRDGKAIASQQSTPKEGKIFRLHENNPHLPAAATTPTQASLVRSGSVKTAKTGIPSLARSPSKPSITESNVTPSLARSPSKHSVADLAGFKATSSSLLSRSPSKRAVIDGPASSMEESSLPLLARSPAKKPPAPTTSQEGENASSTPLLARSPAKKPVAKLTETEEGGALVAASTPSLSRSSSKKALPDPLPHDSNTGTPSKTPLLARAPAKVNPSAVLPFKDSISIPLPQAAQTPAAPSSSLRQRFSALRGAQSAMKSILRSPQRLYSDDPFKVAAGTHVATPKGTPQPEVAPTVPTIKKHVDFSSPEVIPQRALGSPSPTKFVASATKHGLDKTSDVTYPSLPPNSPLAEKTSMPQAPDVVSSPGNFTFRAGTPMLFGAEAVTKASSPKGSPIKATIRRVRASSKDLLPEPLNVGKKRKVAALDDIAEHGEGNKENEPDKSKHEAHNAEDAEDRPAKKAKHAVDSNDAEKGKGDSGKANVKKAASRLPRFGGGANKGAKRGSGIMSQARLAALAMPKKRRGE